MYNRRMGSWLCGPMYEIKLISLLYFRASHDNTVKDFQLAANVANMGNFDDICFKAKVKGFHKPVAVFMQVRHREGKKLPVTDLKRHFGSYLEIKQQFDSRNKDQFLKGTFEENECVFVLYTNATVDGTVTFDDSVGMPFSAKLYDLIGTGGTVMQLCNTDEHAKYLCEEFMKKQMVSLAYPIAKHITDDANFETLLWNDTVLQFHIILARDVVDVSEITPEGHRVATFRPDFFNNNEEYLSIFKDKLFEEIIRYRKIESDDIETLLSQLSADPTDAIKLSKVIGTAVTYNYGLLQINKTYKDYSTPQLEQVNVSQRTVNHALELAAREILSSLRFKVPAAFGNKDLRLRGNETKIDRRISYLAFKITYLLENCESSKIVTIDESLGPSKMIIEAIGNIFVLDDDNSKLMKITHKPDQLGPLAKRLYTQLNRKIHNLHEYKFRFKLNRCPKLSFECNHHEENLVRDFLKRFLFYSNQANEYGVEQILKKEIEYNQSDPAEYFQANSDATFSRYFNLIQNWWSQRHEAPYLTRKLNLIHQSTKDNIKDPLMSSINLICKSKIKKYSYTFNEDAVRSLNLQDQYLSTVIIAENSLLTVTKVMQHLKNKYHVVLDFKYIANLQADERNSICIELTNMNEKSVLILVCNETVSVNDITSLEIIAKAIRYKKTIVVANQTTFKMLQKYFPKADKILQDKKLNLVDLSEASQMSVLETATAVFPGVEIRLDQLLRGCPKPGSK